MDRSDHKDHGGKPEYDLQGRLGNFLISDILQMISFSGKTGTLTLIQGWNTRTISFDQGRICYVAAGARLPGMFDLLVRVGRLQRHQVEGFKARRPGKSEEEMLAELVQRRLLDRADLDRCHELLLESTVYTLFLWRNCLFTFKAGEVVKSDGVAVTIDGNHLIIEGTRRVDEWIQISPVVPSVFMIFRQRPHLIERTVPEALEQVYQYVDGQRDVTTIARVTGLTQFDAAKALYELVQGRFVEAIPPNRRKVCELYNLAVESIYLKLVLYDYSRDALMFENELNRFAVENRLKVRMAAGKVIRSDLETPIGPTELVDLYKLFIGIQNNKFSKMFEPQVFHGLMEGLYLNSDPDFKAMMRMYEFYEIEGLLMLDMFEGRKPRKTSSATDELQPVPAEPRTA
ncbi:MAG: hypothetical protein QOG89_3619 [Thermomicrobiales bacterium]|jgi:hypothetical protein|nr:hypothetical protein [Thermomicrobiales bacterium]MEA2523848.1 hypothetical protein [Thermomicrobiales bacterium]MEA2531975.1 hypothetical protein [Thermomicrobiales bacterium]